MNETKWCRVHQRMEPIGNFYRDATQTDGLMAFCKEEMQRRMSNRRTDGSGRAQASDAKYNRSRKGWWRQKARQAVNKAIKQGLIVKPTHCQFGDALKFDGLRIVVPNVPIVPCMETQIEGHHYKGYDEEHWLAVIWLCPYHHAICETEEQ